MIFGRHGVVRAHQRAGECLREMDAANAVAGLT
jgi:hypothetical protein